MPRTNFRSRNLRTAIPTGTSNRLCWTAVLVTRCCYRSGRDCVFVSSRSRLRSGRVLPFHMKVLFLRCKCDRGNNRYYIQMLEKWVQHTIPNPIQVPTSPLTQPKLLQQAPRPLAHTHTSLDTPSPHAHSYAPPTTPQPSPSQPSPLPPSPASAQPHAL